jgi:hypothetical protein
MEGPAAEEAERRAEEIARGPEPEPPPTRRAVFGATSEDTEPHFLGWVGEVDPDEIFASGAAWALSIRVVAGS